MNPNLFYSSVVVLLVFNVGVLAGFILGSMLRAAKQADEAEKQYEHQSDAPYPRVWE